MVVVYVLINGFLINVNLNNSNFEIFVVGLLDGVVVNVFISVFGVFGIYGGVIVVCFVVGFEYF